MTSPDQLADHRLPMLPAMRLADPEHRQFVVVKRTGLVVGLAREDVGDVSSAKALTGVLHRLEHP